MLPTFLVIGAKKAGSTSLFRYLSAHPQVFMPAAKRLDFFSGRTWDKGVEWYEQQFAPGAGLPARGEASNLYAAYPLAKGVPERIASVVPDVRLVYLIRDPIRRIESLYRQAISEWGETRPIDEVVFAKPAQYLAPTRYAMQLDLYLEHFARDQIHVLTTEAMRDDLSATFDALYSFLDVSTEVPEETAERRYNTAGDQRVQTSLVKRVRSSSVYRAVRRRVPAKARAAAWRATTRESTHAEAQLRLSPPVRDEILARLGPDLERLREIVPGFHCWNLLDA
jgi:hypothetical protein